MHTRIRYNDNLEKYIRLKRLSDGKPAKTPGAFALSDIVEIQLEISRRLGVCAVEMILYDDNTQSECVMSLECIETCDCGYDIYSIKLNLKSMCAPLDNGLFYYCFRLVSGNEHLYISNINNVDFYVTYDAYTVSKFRMLVHRDGHKTPDWAKNAVMYHIFVDRFNKSSHNLPVRKDCVINDNWDTGIPKFAPYPGAPLDNNEFFGGSLYGIIEKLDYLTELGVNCIYLSPIFKSYSNHKYDTGDYMRIDEMFGGEKAFEELIKEATKRDIHIILDGVFNHTGDDSIYFNRKGKYNSVGAYQSEESPFSKWYFFKKFPDKYECWWDIDILPKLNTRNPDTAEYFLSKNGVIRKYVSEGTSGWRLDVVDELPDEFLTKLCEGAKIENPDALIIGEVWENAADKIAYGKRRKYFSGNQIDSVMNYPLKNAIVNFVKTSDCTEFYNTVTELYSSYPQENAGVLMNLLGTHDTERILTLLACENQDLCLSNPQKANYKLDPEKRKFAINLLKIASILQFTLPGMPCIYYGDEAGLEGMGDPFCRRPYPWSNQEAELVEHYKKLGNFKRQCKALRSTDIEFITHEGPACIFKRGAGNDAVYVCVNMNDAPLECSFAKDKKALFGEFLINNDVYFIPPKSAVVFN